MPLTLMISPFAQTIRAGPHMTDLPEVPRIVALAVHCLVFHVYIN